MIVDLLVKEIAVALRLVKQLLDRATPRLSPDPFSIGEERRPPHAAALVIEALRSDGYPLAEEHVLSITGPSYSG